MEPSFSHSLHLWDGEPVSTAPSGEDATTQGEMLTGRANERRLEKGRSVGQAHSAGL